MKNLNNNVYNYTKTKSLFNAIRTDYYNELLNHSVQSEKYLLEAYGTMFGMDDMDAIMGSGNENLPLYLSILIPIENILLSKYHEKYKNRINKIK